MSNHTSTTAQTLYTEVAGTNCYIDGQPGVVTALHYVTGRNTAAGAFVRIEAGTFAGTMLFVKLGASLGDRRELSEILEAHVITRDEFDAMTGIAEARRQSGWRA